jgi:glycosyltransferase involved in cell wall biosynthesis
MFIQPGTKRLRKKKIILSIGRFAATGHTKCQREIAIAFRNLVENSPGVAKGWTLVLAGSANDVSYVSQVREAIDGIDARILTDASFEEIRRLYRDALVYVHASGYGRDEESEPELLEHFGMAVAQALGSGCIPVVFDAAGPKEIVTSAGAGFTYRTVGELTATLARLLPSLDDSGVAREMSKRMIDKAQPFSKSRQRKPIARLVLSATGPEESACPGRLAAE